MYLIVAERAVAWLVALMVSLAPPAKIVARPTYPGWGETCEQRTERYHALAEAAVGVALDPAEAPLWGGHDGRVRTAVTLLALSFKESGWARDVDEGPCYQDPRNPRHCDGGRSACVMQIHIGAGATPEGWTQADLFADRRKCFAAGLHAVRRSFGACRRARNAPEHLLAAYASGVCEKGHRESTERLALGERLWSRRDRPSFR